jgi:hypothetical protein
LSSNLSLRIIWSSRPTWPPCHWREWFGSSKGKMRSNIDHRSWLSWLLNIHVVSCLFVCSWTMSHVESFWCYFHLCWNHNFMWMYLPFFRFFRCLYGKMEKIAKKNMLAPVAQMGGNVRCNIRSKRTGGRRHVLISPRDQPNMIESGRKAALKIASSTWWRSKAYMICVQFCIFR